MPRLVTVGLAVDLHDGIFTSDDGITWTGRSSVFDFNGAASNGGQIWAVAGNSSVVLAAGDYGAAGVSNASATPAGSKYPIALSSDAGLTWSNPTIASFAPSTTGLPIRGLAWSGSLFMAVGGTVGGQSRVATSPDGTTWTDRNSTAPFFIGVSKQLRCVAYGSGKWVVGGTGIKDIAYSSDDGVSWTNVTLFGSNTTVNRIVWNGSLFVLCWAGGVKTSPDGVTWTDRGSPLSTEVDGAAWSPTLGLWVIVGSSIFGTSIATSPDGITWTTRGDPISDNFADVVWQPDQAQFVATGSAGVIATSPDGTTWTNRGSAIGSTGTRDLNSVAYLTKLVQKSFAGQTLPKGAIRIPHMSVAVGQNASGAKLASSPTGVTWTARTTAMDGGPYFASVAYGAGLWVAVGQSTSSSVRRIFTSPDGITWTGRACPVDTPNGVLLGVVYTGTKWVAVGVGAGWYDPYILTSPDGITWTARTTAVTDQLNCVAASRAIVVCGTSNTTNGIQTSPDGITWTARTGPFPVNDVCYSPDLHLFVAVGQSVSGTTYGAQTIATSPDGITWTTRSNPINNGVTFGAASGMACCWSPELALFVVVGRHQPVNPALLTSPDGITWTEHSTPFPAGNSNLASATWNGNLFAASYQDTIITSPDGTTWTSRTDPLAGGAVRHMASAYTPAYPPEVYAISLSGAVGPLGHLFFGDGRVLAPGFVYETRP